MDPMQKIWEETSKEAHDGQRYIILKDKTAVAFFYVTGFVDDAKYSFTDWLGSFQASLQKDGSYRLTHDQWLQKKPFRYDGPIGTLFDPEQIEERDYSEKELVALLKEKIIPNTTLGENHIPKMLEELRSKKQLVNGKMKVTKKIKENVLKMIDEHPSPARMRQLVALEMGKARSSATQEKKEKSQFVTGAAAEKLVQNRLAEISKQLEGNPESRPDVPVISLKDIQKKKAPGGRV